METGELIPKIEAVVPGAILEARPFGRSELFSLWIEYQSVYRVAEVVAFDSGFALDWLDLISCVEVEGALLITYFLRSTKNSNQLLLRVSAPLTEADQMIKVWSVTHVWPMATTFEQELSEFFGIYFDHPHSAPDSKQIHHRVLPQGWVGFPLRKSYVPPMEYLDIPHHRPLGRTSPDEYGVVL